MNKPQDAIKVQNLDHLGIVAGIIEEIELVEEVNKKVGIRAKEILSPGQVMKAMILNGLGFLSAPLYIFEEFFVGKATEHLIGKGVLPEHLNDDRLGRALDKYYQAGTTKLFTAIALKAVEKFQVKMNSVHLDGSSMYVHGDYESNAEASDKIAEEASASDSEMKPIKMLSGSWKYHQIAEIQYREKPANKQTTSIKKASNKKTRVYQIAGEIETKESVIEAEKIKAGRFILATNILDKNEVSNQQVLEEYKGQQSSERGFRFLKDPLFFTSNVFVKNPQRVEAIAMVMGLCLLVYNLAQRKLRQALEAANGSIRNQVKKLTNKPTMRWVFQMFQAVHLVTLNGAEQVSNLTKERQQILNYLGQVYRQYYLIFEDG